MERGFVYCLAKRLGEMDDVRMGEARSASHWCLASGGGGARWA